VSQRSMSQRSYMGRQACKRTASSRQFLRAREIEGASPLNTTPLRCFQMCHMHKSWSINAVRDVVDQIGAVNLVRIAKGDVSVWYMKLSACSAYLRYENSHPILLKLYLFKN
jgi:hypothetical protein